MLPLASCAWQSTVVVPMPKPLPEGGEHATGTAPLTRSTAVGAAYATGLPPAPMASKVGSEGTFAKAGGVVSPTVTVKLVLDWLLAASFAVQLTVVVPSGNVLPVGGEQLAVGLGSTLSAAVTLNETAAPPGPVASTGPTLPALMVGAVVSETVIVNDWTS